MKTQHTPGNWQVVMQPEMNFRIGAYIPGQGCIGLAAECNQNNTITFDQAQANARLIAAAPELLDSLQYIAYAAENEKDFDDGAEISISITGAALYQLREAIKKAKGE
jgi:hypothetical protein